MKNKPQVIAMGNGDIMWEQTFERFNAKVYVPATNLPADIINFGFRAPYLLVFEEKPMSKEEAAKFATESGLKGIASEYAGSVVFIYPTGEGGWKNAKEGLFEEIIENSKIHQYHENGYVCLINRFSKESDGYAIRGAIFNTYLFGIGESADYIAKNLLKTVKGAGLWGPADVTPAVCVLENLSVAPKLERRDIPVVSINNSKETNSYFEKNADNFYVQDARDYSDAFKNFIKNYRRWGWDGDLQAVPDYEKLGMVVKPEVATLKTSPENEGDDKGSTEHKVGYMAYYNKGLFDNGPVPLVLCFHGGGDSIMYISEVAEWYRVAHDNNFLLVCIENHLNSTATEMMELLDILKKEYPIDSEKIYASGFSMGGCKSWDLYQEYPEVFAGLAPMDATFEVGLNVYGKPAPCKINDSILVPIFYVGGEETPLPELPFQAQKCTDRMEYVLKINKATKLYNVDYNDQSKWVNKIWGIDGDETRKFHDESRDSVLTVQYFKSEDGQIYTAFGSVSGQGHECRHHSCENAWQFLKKFRRTPEGIVITE